MFRPFIHFTMPWEKEKLTEEERVRRSLLVTRTRWDAYKAIQAGGSYSVGDRDLYISVRKRLQRMLRNEDKLSRFRFLEPEPVSRSIYKLRAHKLAVYLADLGNRLRAKKEQ